MNGDSSFRSSCLLAMACCFLLLTGCGKSVETAQVSGVVMKNGEPLNEVMVYFLPDPMKGNDGGVSRAVTDKEGRYTLAYTAEGAEAGAVLGWHRVTLEDLASENFRGEGSPPPPRIPPTYMDPSDTPLEVEVVEGEQTIDLEVADK